MKDAPPLLFHVVLGALRPLNPPAANAVKALKPGDRIAVKFGKGGFNLKRLGYYWVLLDVASEHLSDRLPSPIGSEQLHRVMKEKLGLYTEIPLPSGEVFKDYESISVATMSEPDRSAWVERVSNVLARWLGVPVQDLLNEAKSRDAN